ncbi:MAG: methionyl-tRNA formyltransferase [Deltaproteobacteria bacterium]|nr:methionyl-tRNA formyltransferase [Deltaproteobacteria bacterium]
MNILFFGSDNFAIPSLKALHESAHKILAVVTQPDRPAGRGQKLTSCPVAAAARELCLKLLQPLKLQGEEILQQLLALKPDCLAVVAYGKLLPTRLLGSVPHGAVNVHPSLLPKYRGASPVQMAILNGDAVTGVSTMKLVEEMDAGDIYLQAQTPVDPIETTVQLEIRLAEIGAQLLVKTLDGLQEGTLKAKGQDSKKVVMTQKLVKEDGHLKWEESAAKLFDKIRAFNPWPGTFCYIDKKRLKILEAAPLEENTQQKPGTVTGNEQGITVACGQGSLCLLEVQLEGKKRMSTADFLKGHPVKTGILLT